MKTNHFLFAAIFIALIFFACGEIENSNSDDSGGGSSSVLNGGGGYGTSSSGIVNNGGDDSHSSSSGTTQNSSSSLGISSSSKNCTAADNNETQYCSAGTMKNYGSVTDDDDQTYKTVVIGEQTWMAENLNENVEGSVCYNNDQSNCEIYGRLYEWATAMNLDSSCNSSSCSNQIQSPHKGICPDGWHIPSHNEWNKLYCYVDGISETENYQSSTAGKHLKAQNGWNISYDDKIFSNGWDTYGFAALPGGYGSGYFVGSFTGIDIFGSWWSTYEQRDNSSSYRYMNYDYDGARYTGSTKNYLYSIRCIKD